MAAQLSYVPLKAVGCQVIRQAQSSQFTETTRVCVDTSDPQCSCYCSQRHSLACWLVVVGTTGNGIMP
ncbi:hypothetical protein Q7C36_019040 [Tachysurus vachellii]|uniref:Uncharacterized protein n=1 Tax=Tachysurus vachellii TaxID=175792 RepID=A0AA88LVM2_TACVA|nr:hypothetical protein Q7C36_019040 [Tachysurus vachellii]